MNLIGIFGPFIWLVLNLEAVARFEHLSDGALESKRGSLVDEGVLQRDGWLLGTLA